MIIVCDLILPVIIVIEAFSAYIALLFHKAQRKAQSGHEKLIRYLLARELSELSLGSMKDECPHAPDMSVDNGLVRSQ